MAKERWDGVTDSSFICCVTKQRGEIITFCLTGRMLTIEIPKVWKVLAKDLYGKVFADRATSLPNCLIPYLTRAFSWCGIKTNTEEQQVMSFYDKDDAQKEVYH